MKENKKEKITISQVEYPDSDTHSAISYIVYRDPQDFTPSLNEKLKEMIENRIAFFALSKLLEYLVRYDREIFPFKYKDNFENFHSSQLFDKPHCESKDELCDIEMINKIFCRIFHRKSLEDYQTKYPPNYNEEYYDMEYMSHCSDNNKK